MTDLNKTPENLPIPTDDGATDHLLGKKLPAIALMSTKDAALDISTLRGYLVIYCYPMTGVPGIPLPAGWDEIPGARGCTPQSCSFRDHYQELKALNADVVGLSTQITAYQKEMVDRLHLPFPVLSDHELKFQDALKLPVFKAAGMTLLKRVTLIAKDGVIVAVHYPIFPSDSDPTWVMDYLDQQKLR